jgi:hypothetical protein
VDGEKWQICGLIKDSNKLPIFRKIIFSQKTALLVSLRHDCQHFIGLRVMLLIWPNIQIPICFDIETKWLWHRLG